jgi:ribosomal protein L11 methyltransferase
MAFGTGQHPTTRMCLKALEQQATGNRQQGIERVLDLGCGSGILAIAAVGLCAGRVIAVDTEEQAVKAAIANAALNDASGKVEVIHGSLDAVADQGPFDLILANINAATIAFLAIDLAHALAPDGALVAGGIIAERQEAPLAALEATGLRIDQRLEDGDWRTFVCRR